MTLGLVLACAGACQSPDPPRRVLTQEEWRRVQRHLIHEEPVVQHPIDAVFADAIRLIGFDLDQPRVRAGERVEATFYWEVLQPVQGRWHLQAALVGNLTTVVEGHAAEGLYPAEDWQPGHRIRHRVVLESPRGLDAGQATIEVGFRRGDVWMPLSRQGDGRLMESGRLAVGSVQIRWFPPVYTVRRAPTPIRVDGRLDDLAWRRTAASPPLLEAFEGNDAPEELETRFRILWDDEALYLGIEGRDPDVWATITERDGDLWEEEVFEFFLSRDGGDGPYLELQINPLGTVFDALFPGPSDRDLTSARQFRLEGLQSMVHVEGDPHRRDAPDVRWTAELRIPWSGIPFLDGPPEEGTTLRANVYRYERPWDADPILLAWSPVGGPTFHRPERFGQLVFRDFGGATRPQEPARAAPETSSDP